MALGDHLRTHQHGAVCSGEARERFAQGARPRGRVCVEPDALELRNAAGQLRLEPLRAGADAQDLR
jgi:hypothetical protein